MFNNLDDILFVTHTDLDGIGNIIINRYYNLNFGKEISTNYDDKEEHPLLSSFKKVIYTDFSPDEEARNLIDNLGLDCVVVDHHESINNEILEWSQKNQKVEYVYAQDKSGTKLYYEYLLKNGYKENSVLKRFCDLVSTYDLWEKSSEDWIEAQNLNRLMWKLVNWSKKNDNIAMHTFFINGQLWKFQNLDSYYFNKMETTKIGEDIKKENQLFNEYITGKKQIKTRKDPEGNFFAVIRASSKVSILCNRLLEKYKKLRYILCINEYDKENLKLSVRSVDDFDILQFENVEGHSNAGGYSNCTNEFCEDVWNGKVYSLSKRGAVNE